jgi:hypothetical protein
MGDCVDVDTPGRNVGGHEDSHFAGSECCERAISLPLCFVAVYRHRKVAMISNVLLHTVCPMFGPRKNNGLLYLWGSKQVEQRIWFLAWVDHDEVLRNPLDGL